MQVAAAAWFPFAALQPRNPTQCAWCSAHDHEAPCCPLWLLQQQEPAQRAQQPHGSRAEQPERAQQDTQQQQGAATLGGSGGVEGQQTQQQNGGSHNGGDDGGAGGGGAGLSEVQRMHDGLWRYYAGRQVQREGGAAGVLQQAVYPYQRGRRRYEVRQKLEDRSLWVSANVRLDP